MSKHILTTTQFRSFGVCEALFNDDGPLALDTLQRNMQRDGIERVSPADRIQLGLASGTEVDGCGHGGVENQRFHVVAGGRVRVHIEAQGFGQSGHQGTGRGVHGFWRPDLQKIGTLERWK